jgi:uncharacterized RDD family membrane protein YckC
LRYELAGLGSRFLALAIDAVLQTVAAAAVVVAFISVSLQTVASRGKLLSAIEFAVTVALLFVIFFGYFVVFETIWRGQTPGKRALGIRVVRDGGYPIDFGAALVRNVIRIGEVLLGYYALSALCMLLSSENKRLGDFAAGTIVVRDSQLAYTPRGTGDLNTQYAPTFYLSGSERAVVKRFLERRDALDDQKRRELAHKLAARIRDRVPTELQRLDDESLLERV